MRCIWGLFVLTAKNLQQEMALKVLRQLSAGGELHALRLRAKARMCANGEVILEHHLEPLLRRAQRIDVLAKRPLPVAGREGSGSCERDESCDDRNNWSRHALLPEIEFMNLG